MVHLDRNTTQVELFRYRRWPWPYINGVSELNKGNFLAADRSESRQLQPLYGYYYIERQLWYVPLYFSVYFVFYVGSLVLKAISRHRVYFPQTVAAAVAPVVKVFEKVMQNYGQTADTFALKQPQNYGQSLQTYGMNNVPSYSQSMKDLQLPGIQNYQLNKMQNYGIG